MNNVQTDSKFLDGKEYNGVPIEILVKKGIWRTRKENGYKYQLLSTMSKKHIERCIGCFEQTKNVEVLQALYEELRKRYALTEEIKQKINNIKENNKMSTDSTNTTRTETQTEFAPIVNETSINTAQDAAQIATEIKANELPVFPENPYERRYKAGDVVGDYIVLDVFASANNRGYMYKVKNSKTNAETTIAQAAFLKMMHQPPAKNLAIERKKKTKEAKDSTKVKVIKTKKGILAVGDMAGKYKIINVRISNKGKGGQSCYALNTQKEGAKPTWMKRSVLPLKVEQNNTTSQPVIVNSSVEKFYEPVEKTEKITKSQLRKEIKKLSWWEKIKLIFGFGI